MHFKLSNILNDINTIIVPRLCFGCNARLYRGEQILCTFCRNELPLTEFNFSEENAVDRIFYGRVKIKKASSFLYYKEHSTVKTMIHYLKYKNQEPIGIFLGDWFGAKLAKDPGTGHFDTIIPVPLHRKKMRLRGYNQVTEFAKRLAHHLKTNYRDDLLMKNFNTKTQTRKSRLFRLEKNQSLYSLSDPLSLANKEILLVDDVITTGATIEACVKALQKAPGITISVATMAVVP